MIMRWLKLNPKSFVNADEATTLTIFGGLAAAIVITFGALAIKIAEFNPPL